MTNNAREQIADACEVGIDNVHDMDVTLRDYAEGAAKEVLAALPSILEGMIEPLEWEASTYIKRFMSDSYVVQKEYDGVGNACWAFGYNDKWVSDHDTKELAIEAANAHHRAEALRPFNLSAIGVEA